MKDVALQENMHQQALLMMALYQAENESDERLPRAGLSKEEYAMWRAWVLILKAISRQVRDLMDQSGIPYSEDAGLYLSVISVHDHQFITKAVEVVESTYKEALGRQDILNASAFDAARQAVKRLAENLVS